MIDSRYDILFQPLKIGPVTAKNRFYQVPHCCGMGHAYPRSVSAIRAMKAQGGWAVVSTEETEIHHTSDISPALEGRLWDDSDIAVFQPKTDAIHAHGALAAIELCHNGSHAPNLYSRATPLAPSNTLVDWGMPINARAMDKSDIADLRRWYVNAAKRAKTAGFDIIYVYAGHDMSILQHFLSARHNRRGDDYGGSLANRMRLLREVLADTKEAVGDKCAVAIRLAVDELLGKDGLQAESEGHDIIAAMADEPDLWDVNISGWENDSQTARFSHEGYQNRYISFVRQLTSRPVVGVGRFTSPDTMAALVKKGVVDFVGAARPSIADPFLPEKIRQGRSEDIRECIGCNICVASDNTSTPIRCTQNPTMGEEWRRGWHPEEIDQLPSPPAVLVVGGGPAGLEAALTFARRGCDVTLAEKTQNWGGRVRAEAGLPGLGEWARVRDWRLGQLQKLANVEMYLASEMAAGDVLAHDARHIVLATGARWQAEGFTAIDHLTPDDIMAGQMPKAGQHIAVWDSENFYMGGLVAEKCALAGNRVTYITNAALVSDWTVNTLEQKRIQKRLLDLGVTVICNHELCLGPQGGLQTTCIFTGKTTALAADTVVPVTVRSPCNALEMDLAGKIDADRSLITIGDCHAPASIAAAVYSGHRAARDFGTPANPDVTPFRREPILF